MNIYSLQDINDISESKFDYNIPQKIIDMINNITRQVSSPSYTKTPVFVKGNSILSNTYNKNNKCGNDKGWKRLPPLKKTVIKRNEGIDGKIAEIRVYLNKLSLKTYDNLLCKIKDIIYYVIYSYIVDCDNDDIDEIDNDTEKIELTNDIINDVLENELASKDLTKICDNIFVMASSNLFYSDLYAKLYVDLVKKYSFLYKMFEISYANFSNNFTDIKYTDPNINYDEFCVNNRINEKRKALSTFFINLRKYELITDEYINILLIDLTKQLIELCDDKQNINIINEVVENISILYGDGSLLDESVCVDGIKITDIIIKFSNENSIINPGISNKTKFKFYTMLGK
jgi:hypothetical protein